MNNKTELDESFEYKPGSRNLFIEIIFQAIMWGVVIACTILWLSAIVLNWCSENGIQ